MEYTENVYSCEELRKNKIPMPTEADGFGNFSLGFSDPHQVTEIILSCPEQFKVRLPQFYFAALEQLGLKENRSIFLSKDGKVAETLKRISMMIVFMGNRIISDGLITIKHGRERKSFTIYTPEGIETLSTFWQPDRLYRYLQGCPVFDWANISGKQMAPVKYLPDNLKKDDLAAVKDIAQRLPKQDAEVLPTPIFAIFCDAVLVFEAIKIREFEFVLHKMPKLFIDYARLYFKPLQKHVTRGIKILKAASEGGKSTRQSQKKAADHSQMRQCAIQIAAQHPAWSINQASDDIAKKFKHTPKHIKTICKNELAILNKRKNNKNSGTTPATVPL